MASASRTSVENWMEFLRRQEENGRGLAQILRDGWDEDTVRSAAEDLHFNKVAIADVVHYWRQEISRPLRARMKKMEEFYNIAKPTLQALADIYTQKFSSQIVTLPDLTIYPKSLTNLENILLRELPYKFFQTLQMWDTGSQLPQQYGMYLAGPNGIGKSIAIYTLVCLAKAHDWIVLYIPNCDEWANCPTKHEMLQYLLDKFVVALVPYYNQPSQRGPTWGEIIANGVGGNTENALSILLTELSQQKERPFLMVFDEVNALFSQKLPWNNNSLAKEGPYFSNLAAALNRFTMERGWKVISGTGHERFIFDVPSGLTSLVHYLSPWSADDFRILVGSNIHPWVCSTINKNKQMAINFKAKITSVTGRVPRQLIELNQVINRTFGTDTTTVNDFFDKINRPDGKKWNPFTKLDYILNEFSTQMRTIFANAHVNYYTMLPQEMKPTFAKNCLDVLTYNSVPFIPTQYLDTNLIYMDHTPGTTRYFTLTPAAEQALLLNLGLNRSTVLDDEQKKILYTANIDEAGRPFKSLFYRSLLLTDSFLLETTQLDGSGELKNHLCCAHSYLLRSPQLDMIQSGMLFKDPVPLNTMLVPSDYYPPVMDYVLVVEQAVYIFQVTLMPPIHKVPGPDNAYSALYNYPKWESSVRIKPKDPKYNTFAHKNFAECLLNSVANTSNSEVVIDNKKQLVVVNPPDWQLVYVIVTPHELSNTPELTAAKAEFPWVRVLTNKCLRELLGDSLCALLAKKYV